MIEEWIRALHGMLIVKLMLDPIAKHQHHDRKNHRNHHGKPNDGASIQRTERMIDKSAEEIGEKDRRVFSGLFTCSTEESKEIQAGQVVLKAMIQVSGNFLYS